MAKQDQALVDYIAETTAAKIDTSLARRLIVEGRVKVNGAVVTDPAYRGSFAEGVSVDIDRSAK